MDWGPTPRLPMLSPRTRAPLRASPDPQSPDPQRDPTEVAEDAPLSD